MTELSTSEFGRLTGLIYDCAVEPAGWSSTVDALRQVLGYEIGVLALHELPHGRVLLDDTVNVGAPWEARRAMFHADAVALWGGIGFIQSHPVAEPAALSRVTRGALDRSRNPWVSDWAGPQGLVDYLALVLARDGGAIGCIGFGRHHQVGAIDDHDLATARLFIPHLQRAAAIGRLLDMRQARSDDLSSALDGLSQPVLLLDGEGRILHGNAAAHAMLEAGDPLRAVNGILSSPTSGVTPDLRRAIDGCVRTGAPPGRGFGIPARDRSGGVHALHVLPLGATPATKGTARKAVAAVFVASAAARACCAADLVGALYGLTRTETRVFELVAEGCTPKQASGVMGVSASTFKTHLLRVFAKLGVHRQGELVRLANAVASPFDAPRPSFHPDRPSD